MLSFLDVLSCGLGGSICLFLVFSVMPHHGSAGISDGASGQEAAVVRRGANFDDLKDRLRYATVQVRVVCDAIGTDLVKEDARWIGLPNTAQYEYVFIPPEQNAAGGTPVQTFVATIVKGMNPDRVVEFQLRTSKLDPTANPQCQVVALVGGWGPSKIITLNSGLLQGGAEWTDIFRLDFAAAQEDWIMDIHK